MTSNEKKHDPEKVMNVEEEKTARVDVVSAHPVPPGQKIDGPGGSRGLILLFAAVVVIGAIVYGLHSRSVSERSLERATADASILTVHTIRPSVGTGSQELILPGSVLAFTETPIFSRTDGYLKKWYFDIGARVRKGQLLAEIETPEIDQQLQQSRAELERIQANMELAGVTSNRWESLLAKHAVSQQEADQARSNYIAAQAAVDASKANVRRLEQLQSYERILAPFDGIITARNTDIGDLIQAGSGSTNPRELFHLAAVEKLRIYVSVPEVYADSIQDGATATVTQDSNPGLKIPAKIVRNANAIDHATRTLNVEVDVDNSKSVLRPGAYVFVHFALAAGAAHSVTIPSNTLLFRAEGLRVGVVRSNRVELVPIAIGQDYGNTVQVVSGLTLSDQVVLDPSDSLTSGAEVRTADATSKGKQ